MKLSSQIRQMQKLLATPDDWSLGSLARTARRNGLDVHPSSSEARCFCLIGGAARVMNIPETEDDVFTRVSKSSLGQLLSHVIAGRDPATGPGDARVFDYMEKLRNGTCGGVDLSCVMYRFNDFAVQRNVTRKEGHAEILSVLEEAELLSLIHI